MGDRRPTSARAVDEDELYDALDWLLERQPAIETSLARKHLADGVLVLYDVTSSYLEGRCCPLSKLGYSRDGKKGKPQIVYGLLCAADGCPVAVEVFDGDTADPKTLSAQIAKPTQARNRQARPARPWRSPRPWPA